MKFFQIKFSNCYLLQTVDKITSKNRHKSFICSTVVRKLAKQHRRQQLMSTITSEELNKNNKYKCTIDQELVDAAAYARGRHQMCIHQVATLSA